MKPGDVFVVSLPDGRYGAVRVIRQIDKSSLVYTSTYLGQNTPDIEEPKLLEILEQHRFRFKGQPAMKWLDGQPKSALHIGNIPPSVQETETVCQIYGGKWSESTGAEVLWEWRWKYDREAYKEEIKQRDRKLELLRRKPQKPKKMMAEQTFWKIIELLDWSSEGNDSKVITQAIRKLSDMSSVAICEFAETLAFKLYELDTKKHALNAGPFAYDADANYVSADGFLYARCVVVANGKQYYNEVLEDPTRMPKDLEFEALLSIAPKAYELKTGQDFEYTTGCSFETFSNVEGWQ